MSPLHAILMSPRPFAYRLRLILDYFLNVSLFDIRYRTKTSSFPTCRNSRAPTRAQEIPYMPSFTGPIIKAHRFLREEKVFCFEGANFLDIGCGAGKALILWAKLNAKYGVEQKIVGVEIEPCLALAARNNFEKTRVEVDLITGDISAPDVFGQFDQKENAILYLYNPFGEKTLLAVLRNFCLEGHTYLVYVNPQHESALISLGFVQILSVPSWHSSMTLKVFHKAPSVSSLTES